MQITLQITIDKVNGFHHLVFISKNGPMSYKCTSGKGASFSYNITDNGKCSSMWLDTANLKITPKESPYPSSVFTGSGSANSVYSNNAYYYARGVLGDRLNKYPWITNSKSFTGKWTATFTNPDFRGGFLAFAFGITNVHSWKDWYNANSSISIKISSNGKVLYDYTGLVKSELFNNIVDPSDVNNPLYLNFANPLLMQDVRYTPIFDISLLHNSEYIRRSYFREQEVTTDLNFTGKLLMPYSNVISKSQVDHLLGKESIKDYFPGLKYGQLQI